MEEYYIICDFREDFPNLNNSGQYYNDHPRKETVEEICVILKKQGYDCKIFGGLDKLIHHYNNKIPMPEGIYINMSDGKTEEYKRIQVPIIADLLKINYSGCNPFLAGLITNKYYSNCAIKELGVNVPKCILFDQLYTFNYQMIKTLAFPIIVKPNTDGSSLGISNDSICFTSDEAKEKYKELKKIIPKLSFKSI